MKLHEQTILAYSNFNALSKDILDLAKEVLPNKAIYINFLNDDIQVTMKVSEHDTKVNLLEGTTIPVTAAICNQIDYKTGKPLVLNDIKSMKWDISVQSTVDSLNAGSYLGIPISFQNGTRFGTLCAAHDEKNAFSEKEVELLSTIAKLFSYYLELEHMAFKDALTGLYNMHFLKAHVNRMTRFGGLSIMLDLDFFKQVNDVYGHSVGDEVLIEVAKKLEFAIEGYKEAYAIRIGGDEFFVHITDSLTVSEVETLLNSLVKALSDWRSPIGDLPLSSSLGAYHYLETEDTSLEKLLKQTDDLLYKAKYRGKNTYRLLSNV